MIIELAICSDLLLSPPSPPSWASHLVTGVYMDIKQQVNSDDDWSLRPSSPPLNHQNMSLHIGIRVRWVCVQIKQVMGINYLNIKLRVNFDRVPKIVLKVWNDSLDTPELLVNLQFKIDSLTWQKYFALFCKTISEIFINGIYQSSSLVSWCRDEMCQVIGGNLRTDIKIVVLAPGILFVIICFANIQPRPPRPLSPPLKLKSPPSNPPLHQDPSLPITCPVAVFLNGVQKTYLEQRLLYTM